MIAAQSPSTPRAAPIAAVDFAPAVSGNETRTEHAKALIFCGATAPLADWQRSTGLGLEIYPQEWNGRRPRLKPGEPGRYMVVTTVRRPDPQKPEHWLVDTSTLTFEIK